MKPATPDGRGLLMLSTAAPGGIRSVVEGYRASGVFERWSIDLLLPHAEGSLPARLGRAGWAYLRFVGLLLRRRIGLVHAHAAMRGSFWRKAVFLLTARLFRVPVILHLHGSETVRFIETLPPAARRVVRFVLEQASCVLVLSARWQAFVATVAPRARIVILPNYVAMPTDAAPPLQASGQPLRVLFLGAVGHRKGIFPLIDAFALAAERIGRPAQLLVGGDGALDAARAHAALRGVADQVQFLGWVSGEAKTRLLQQADLFVLPSFNEGLPMSLLEAMAHRVPVISTRVGGIPDLVTDGVDGLLVDAGDVPALAAAIGRALSSAALRGQLAERGHQRVAEAFSEAAVVPQLEGLYQQLRGEN